MEVLIYLLQIFLVITYYYLKTFTKFEEGIWLCFRDMNFLKSCYLGTFCLLLRGIMIDFAPFLS
jgi:hypothetical protein